MRSFSGSVAILAACTALAVSEPSAAQAGPAREGWFAIRSLHGPLEPIFTKEGRPSEIALVQ